MKNTPASNTKRETIKRLADILYHPEDSFILSKARIKDVAEKLYGKIGEVNSNKFVDFYKSNRTELDYMINDYVSLYSSISDIAAVFIEEPAKNLVYKIASKMEHDARKVNYDIKKLKREIAEKKRYS